MLCSYISFQDEPTQLYASCLRRSSPFKYPINNITSFFHDQSCPFFPLSIYLFFSPSSSGTAGILLFPLYLIIFLLLFSPPLSALSLSLSPSSSFLQDIAIEIEGKIDLLLFPPSSLLIRSVFSFPRQSILFHFSIFDFFFPPIPKTFSSDA